MLQYRFAHLYFLVAWVPSKRYFLIGQTCKRGSELSKNEVEANLTQNPIPFYQRYSWSFLVA